MQQEQQQKVLTAFQLVLRPIVKILLRYGIGFGEFAEAVKTAFVDVASTEFGIRGRPTNISRVAVMTGLTRKEVRRLRTKIEDGTNTIKVKTTPLMEVLHRWHAEDEFLDGQGAPKVLPFSGETGSFSSLVKHFGGDIPPGAMRTELKRVGSVDEDDQGNIRLVARHVVSDDLTAGLLSVLLHSVYPLLSTVAHNSDGATEGDKFPQFAAYSLAIRQEDRARLKRMCLDRLTDMAENVDDLFIAYEALGDDAEKKVDGTPVMVGLYYFEEKDKNALYEW